MRPAYRNYLRHFLPAMLAYVVVVLAASILVTQVQSVPVRVMIALSPMAPIALAARALLRFVGESDELERRVELEALALAALLLTTGTFALGLLSNAKLLNVSGSAVLILMMPIYMLLYGACKGYASWRYR